MRSPLNYKTAHWKGIIHPDLDPPDELVIVSVRLPKDLADDVALAAHEYRRWFAFEEELVATAVSWMISNLAEVPFPDVGENGLGISTQCPRTGESDQEVGPDLPDEQRHLRWEGIGPGTPPVLTWTEQPLPTHCGGLKSTPVGFDEYSSSLRREPTTTDSLAHLPTAPTHCPD